MLQQLMLTLEQSSKGGQLVLLQRALKRRSAASSALSSPCKASSEPPVTQASSNLHEGTKNGGAKRDMAQNTLLLTGHRFFCA